jgi:hypothetical protein
VTIIPDTGTPESATVQSPSDRAAQRSGFKVSPQSFSREPRPIEQAYAWRDQHDRRIAPAGAPQIRTSGIVVESERLHPGTAGTLAPGALGYLRPLPTTTALFFEPKPRQLQARPPPDPPPAVRDEIEVARRIADVRLMVGGRNPPQRQGGGHDTGSSVAPCGWPIIDLVDEPATRSARLPNSWRTQRDRQHR